MANRTPRAPETEAAQALHGFESSDGAVTPPLQPATTFVRDRDYALLSGDYQRDHSPTLHPAEALLAHLEGGREAMLYASGMAAAAAVIQSLRPGEHIVAQRVMYWGLRKWLQGFCQDFGIALDLVDADQPGAIQAALRPGQTRIVWIETPSNPMPPPRPPMAPGPSWWSIRRWRPRCTASR
jgi:cystathionine gamma-synthase